MPSGRIGTFFQTRVFHADPESRRQETETFQKISREAIGETFLEEDPTVAEWFRSLLPTSAGAGQYVQNLFPSAQWMRRYNLHWLLGDSIAGEYLLERVPHALC